MIDKKYLFKRGNIWYLRVTRTPTEWGLQGKDFVHSLGTADLKSARMIRDKYIVPILLEDNAREMLYKLSHMIQSSQATTENKLEAFNKAYLNKASSELLLKELCAKYIEFAEHGDYKPSTLKLFRSTLNALCKILGNIPIRSITKEKISSFRDTLAKLPASWMKIRHDQFSELFYHKGKKVSPTTIDNYLRRIRTFFNWAVGEGYLSENPAIGVKSPYTKKSVSKIISTSDADKLINLPFPNTNLIDILSWQIIPLIARYTGARLAEIAQLHQSDFFEYLLRYEFDAKNNRTEFVYNSDNLLTQVNEPDDAGAGYHAKVIVTYDAYNRVASTTDGEGRTTSFAYDDRERLIKTTFNDTSTELIIYGSTNATADLVVKRKDRNGNVTKMDYDSFGRNFQTITAYSTMDKDGNNEVVNSSDLQSVTTRTYLNGQTAPRTVTVNGDKTEYIYDYRLRPIAVTRFADASSTLISESEYKDNKLFKSTDPYGRRTYHYYRSSDFVRTRTIQETIVGTVNLTSFNAVKNKARDLISNNADFLISDIELDASGLATASIDPKNIRSETDYDSRRRTVLQVRDAGAGLLNQTVETLYDANSNVIEVRNPRYFEESIDDRTTMAYTRRNLLESRTVAPGSLVEATESFTYYADSRRASHTDFRGNTSNTEWHKCCGRFQAAVDQASHASVSTTDFYGNVTHTAVLEGYTKSTAVNMPSADLGATGTQSEHNYNDTKTMQEVTVRFDERHRPIAQTVWLDKLGDVQANDVPIAGDAGVTETGLTSQTIYFDETTGHSELTPLLTELSNDGITFDANADGSAVISINGEGEVAVSIADGVGRTIATGMYDKDDWALDTYTLVTWSTVTHDTIVNDLLETKTTSALDFVNKSQTDGAGRTIKTIDAESKEANFEYDANSNLVKSRDANSVGLDCVFDNLNRDISCTDTDGDSTSKVYDLNNNVVKAVDGLGKFSLIAYDERNRTSNSWDRLVTSGYDVGNLPPLGDSTRYTYDNNSNVTDIEDVLEKVTSYVFDVRNLAVKTTYPDHVGGTSAGDADYGITECSFDALRRKDVCTDQLGDNVTYIYDLASRLLNREYRLEDTTLESTDTFTYDDVSRVLTAAKGRYSNTCTYTYDEIGRRKTEKTTVGGNDYTITHTYDADNRITNCQYPNGDNVAKTWTDRNQLESVKFNAASIIDNTYDNGMRESTRTFGNGLINTMTYNLDNTREGISVAGKADLSFDYTYDANKNISAETSTGSVMDDYSFTADFDDKDRVEQWDRTNLDSQTWTQDLIGNWSNTTGTLDGNSFNENRTHNDAHELTDMGGNSVVYDAKGNMTNDAWLNSLTWDIDNHLKTHGAVDFTYDALGRRLEKKTSTGNTLYICSGQRVVEEYSDDLLGGGYVLARSYVHGSYVDDIVAKIEESTGDTHYYHSDRQFNVRGLTDDTGAIVELYAYSVYGKQIILDSAGTVQVGSAYGNNYGFTGRYIDTETGLWYFRARYFSDEMGRFINRDPLGYVDGMSLYASYFAMMFRLDPSGTVIVTDCPIDKYLPYLGVNAYGRTKKDGKYYYTGSATPDAQPPQEIAYGMLAEKYEFHMSGKIGLDEYASLVDHIGARVRIYEAIKNFNMSYGHPSTTKTPPPGFITNEEYYKKCNDPKYAQYCKMAANMIMEMADPKGVIDIFKNETNGIYRKMSIAIPGDRAYIINSKYKVGVSGKDEEGEHIIYQGKTKWFGHRTKKEDRLKTFKEWEAFVESWDGGSSHTGWVEFPKNGLEPRQNNK